MIDLRSDTVTRPTESMLAAMAAAPVGDDVYGEDPTVNQLESLAAAQLGFEAALFASSGTQTNLLALLAHCQRGDEYIVGQQAHTYKYEGGGAAVLGSIQPQPLDTRADGTIPLESIEAAIKPDDFHFARTRLVALENTMGGKPLPMDYFGAVRELADSRNLNLHLDGARVFNASVHHKVSIVALNENVERLQDDHNNAKLLHRGLAAIDGLNVDAECLQTNMVFLPCGEPTATRLATALKEHDIVISPAARTRLVVHKDISTDDIETVVAAVKKVI